MSANEFKLFCCLKKLIYQKWVRNNFIQNTVYFHNIRLFSNSFVLVVFPNITLKNYFRHIQGASIEGYILTKKVNIIVYFKVKHPEKACFM